MFQSLQPEYYQFQLAALPITLICHHTGKIALVKSQQFKVVYESTIDNTEIIISEDSVKFVSDELAESYEVEYNKLVTWKDKPLLKKWLQSFGMTLNKPAAFEDLKEYNVYR